MDTKPHTVFSNTQDLLTELRNRSDELQRVKEEMEELNTQITQHRQEMDRRTLLLLFVDEGLMDALKTLDSVKRHKCKLETQIQELTTRHLEHSAVCVSDVQREEATLLKEETELKLQLQILSTSVHSCPKDLEPPEPSASPVEPPATVRPPKAPATRR